ncbi:acyl-CoA synthetase family member 4-like isoform X2 [Mizuhopecten yessoensis]|nr:acyl-CoA synthetase family member 4-like isoform X2 [Mizuhopecten yessoensis]XP_021339199.1 acyl-CoA synthetase family member 4-like isoform X2 [Mizuhopecten yessoensis]XP_021339200.1 acyl-CoA synthetase family member 4-like isoform X2 [Mizuhopecten yessoensis]
MMPRSLLSMLYHRHKVTYLQATPSLVSRIGSEVLKNTLLGSMSQLKTLAFGGEKFPSISLLQKWRAPDNSTKFYNLYGTTEVSCWSTCYEVTDKDFRNLTVDVPFGQPLKDTRVTVLGDDGQEVCEGKGQLYLGGIKGRQCYLTGEETDKGPPVLRPTGDLVSINSKGEITFLHRLDDQVKRNGRRINLCEIEKILLKLDAVADCRAIFHQSKLMVFVVLQVTKTIDSPKLHLWIKESLPSQYWPDSVVMVTKFPVTRHGKLDKTALLQTVDAPRIRTGTVTAGSVAVVVETIWSGILLTRHHRPTVDSKFITSGGDSLLAVQFSEKVEATFNKRLPKLLDIILHDTYANILCYIEECVCGQSQKIPQKNSQTENVYLKSIVTGKFDTESVMKKIGTENLNVNDVDIVIEDFNERKKPFDVPIDSKGKSFNRKRKYYDNKAENQNLKNLGTKASFMIKTKTDHRSVNDHIILSVGRGNNGIMRANLKEDVEIEHESTSTSVFQTQDCNLDRRATDTFSRPGPSRRGMTLDICWKVNTGKCVDASPVIARDRTGGHTVYIGSHSYKFYAITMETGEVQWETTLGDRIESSACISTCGNYIIVGCYDGAVYVMECLTGEIWWKYKTGAEVKSSPVVDPQTSIVYVGSHDKHLYALDIKTRSCLFKTYLGGGSVFSSPTLSSSLNAVYVGTLSGAVSALDSSNGEIMWMYDCEKPLFSSPSVSSEGIYIGCVDGCLYHISTDGRLIWSFETAAPVFSSPVIHQQLHQKDLKCINKSFNQIIIFGSHDNYIYVLSYDGKLLWKRKLDSPIYSVPFCFDLVIDEQLSESELHFDDQSDILSKDKSAAVKVEVGVSSTLKADIQGTCMTKPNIDSFSHQSSAQQQCYNEVDTSQKDTHSDWKASDDDSCSGQRTTTLNHMGKDSPSDLKQSAMETSVNQTYSRVDENLSCDTTVQQQCVAAPEQLFSLFMHTDHAFCHGNRDKSTDDNIHSSKSRSPHHVMPLCVVATTTGSIHVVDRCVGEEVGVVRLPGEVFSSPVVCGRNIVVGCRDNYVYCLSITPGTCYKDIKNY